MTAAESFRSLANGNHRRIIIVDFSLTIFPLDGLARVGGYYTNYANYTHVYVYSESTRFSRVSLRGSMRILAKR